jgi:hypothetical protein
MTRRPRQIAATLGLVLAAAVVTVVAQSQGNRQGDQQILGLLDRTSRDAQQFDRAVDLAMGKNPNRPVNPTAIEDDVDQLVNQLLDTTRHLRDHYTRRQVINADVEEVLARGAGIDAFMRRNQLAPSAENSWLVVRRDLDELARAFNITWNWASPRMTPEPGPDFYNRLSGSYQLDRTRSDDPRRIADLATRGLGPGDRQRAQQNLIARLESPDFISLDRNGPTMSIASSNAPRATFDIDGRAHTELTPYGGFITVRASFYGDQLVVATTGNRGTDFTVTFEPMDGGRTLRITRRVDSSGLTDMVEAQSFYRRTAEQPRWELYVAPAPPPVRSDYLVAEGTVLVGRLDAGLGNRTSHQGDRFSMTVDSPAQFRGAVIDGIVAKVNGSNRPGRSDLLFDFDRIRLRDGRTSEFEGFLREVRTPDGTTVLIDVEGVARTGSGEARSGDPVQRGAIGATFGAIIGAIAGGGKGAAIGAVIGGGAGAGSVFIEGRDLNLPRGTEVTVIARTPWDNR